LKYSPNWMSVGINLGILAACGLLFSETVITAESLAEDATPVLFGAAAGMCLYEILKEAYMCMRSGRVVEEAGT